MLNVGTLISPWSFPTDHQLTIISIGINSMVRKYEGGPFAPAAGFPARAIQLDPSGVFLAAAKDRVMKIFRVDGEEIASLELFHSARLLSWAGPRKVICGSDEGYIYVIDLVEVSPSSTNSPPPFKFN